MSAYPPRNTDAGTIFNTSDYPSESPPEAVPETDSGLFDHPFTPMSANALEGPVTVTFNRTFTSAPSVTANGYGPNSNGCSRLIVTIDAVSTTGFVYFLWNNQGSPATAPKVSWVAICQ